MTALPLNQTIGNAFILAYRENVDRLAQTLSHEQFTVEVLRQQDEPEYQGYANSYRCMLNHYSAWQRASQSDQPSLIVEADFVPTKQIGQQAAPFASDQSNVGIAWLYTCASQLYHVTEEGFAEGFSSSLVAYVVSPAAAKHLCEFVNLMTQAHGTGYSTFDSEIEEFLRLRGFKNYIPWRNYGEHGSGNSNPEHRLNNSSGVHRADVLYNQLAFSPDYVSTTGISTWQLLKTRSQGRLRGFARLVVGRYLRLSVLTGSKVPLRLLRFAILRQLSWY